MKIYKILGFLALAVLTTVMSMTSCRDDLHIDSTLQDEGCEIIYMPVNVNAVDLEKGLESRSVDENLINEGDSTHNSVKDIWILQYKSDGGIAAEPTYVEVAAQAGSQIAVPIARPRGSDSYRVVVLANTHNSNLSYQLSNYTTTKMLSDWYIQFISEESGYNASSVNDGKHDMLLNGYQTITSTTESLDVKLYHTMAKVSVSVEVAPQAGVKLASVQMKNVSSRYTMVDQLVKDDPKLSFPVAGKMHLPKEQWKEGESKMTLTYYLPRNMRGDNDSDSETHKNYNAPAGATFVEVMGNKTDGSIVIMKFYLGSNMVNNFDLQPNYHYVLPIKINSASDISTDSRVEVMNSTEFKNANSFILSMVNDTTVLQPIYTVPINRINDYWGNTYTGDQRNTIGDNDEWIADVVWQDCGDIDMFHFVDASGKELAGDTPHFYTGKGKTPFYVRPTGKAFGNAVIGIKKKNQGHDGYLWSWHLWFTDYNPNQYVAKKEGKHAYAVTGGLLYRFATDYWEQNLPQSFLMDRNLGATYGNVQPDIDQLELYSLYYQFGRKDPMPLRKDINTAGSPIKRYKIDENGKEKSENVKFTSINRKAELKEAIYNPTVFYYYDSDRWCSDYDTDGTLTWNLCTWDTAHKNIMDPTPEGWMIPTSIEAFQFGSTLKFIDSNNLCSTFKFVDSGEEIQFIYSGWNKISNLGSISNDKTACVWALMTSPFNPSASSAKFQKGNPATFNNFKTEFIAIRLIKDTYAQ